MGVVFVSSGDERLSFPSSALRDNASPLGTASPLSRGTVLPNFGTSDGTACFSLLYRPDTTSRSLHILQFIGRKLLSALLEVVITFPTGRSAQFLTRIGAAEPTTGSAAGW